MFLACTIGRETSFSIGTTVEVGGSLELSQIVGAGVSFAVSTTETEGVAQVTSSECTGPWTCALLITPTMIQVKGEKTTSGCRGGKSTDPYEVLLPELDSDNLAVGVGRPCACKNCLSWADEGAPEPCPQPCAVDLEGPGECQPA